MSIASVWKDLRGLAADKKRLKRITDSLNRAFERGDHLYPKVVGFERDFASTYPELKTLEEQYPVIREECDRILAVRHRLTDVEALGGSYTKGGIHAAGWKSFMFKSGSFIEENCRVAPRTANLLRQVPDLFTAFFSVLEPHQYITPHWGYWKGFVRFHLGVAIPDNNANRACWLRINCKPEDHVRRDKALIERGDKYYWKNGEGVLFDDTFLHDAKNESDEPRVILWLDIARRMPEPLHTANSLFLKLAYLEPSIARIRKQAIVTLQD
jgi:ornithine lipid ester-linked acyl 2-hydroxylase